MKELRYFDTSASEVQETVIKSVGKDKVKIWVEGSDWRLYNRFFDHNKVSREGRDGGHSCHSAVDSYREYKKQFPEKLAIVIRDADFKRTNGENLNADADIFYADCHDHEMMCIFQKRVRDALMNNFECPESVETFFDNIFEELKLLSYLKWYNYNNHSGYNFGTLSDLFGLKDTELKDIAALEKDVYDRTCSSHRRKNITDAFTRISMDDLLTFIKSHEGVDRYDLTNGHDFYNRINYHLQKIDRKNSLSENQLKAIIYTAFEFLFVNTDLYKRLDEWCKANNCYILKAV